MKLPNLKIAARRLMIFVVAAAASIAFSDGQTTIQPKPKKVKVYFMVYEPTGKLKLGLNPVVREVDSSAPLRPRLKPCSPDRPPTRKNKATRAWLTDAR